MSWLQTKERRTRSRIPQLSAEIVRYVVKHEDFRHIHTKEPIL